MIATEIREEADALHELVDRAAVAKHDTMTILVNMGASVGDTLSRAADEIEAFTEGAGIQRAEIERLTVALQNVRAVSHRENEVDRIVDAAIGASS